MNENKPLPVGYQRSTTALPSTPPSTISAALLTAKRYRHGDAAESATGLNGNLGAEQAAAAVAKPAYWARDRAKLANARAKREPAQGEGVGDPAAGSAARGVPGGWGGYGASPRGGGSGGGGERGGGGGAAVDVNAHAAVNTKAMAEEGGGGAGGATTTAEPSPPSRARALNPTQGRTQIPMTDAQLQDLTDAQRRERLWAQRLPVNGNKDIQIARLKTAYGHHPDDAPVNAPADVGRSRLTLSNQR